MCVAVPARITEISGKVAKVDFGGVMREVDISLVERNASVGKYVIVHAGFAIEVLDEKEARETISLFEEILAENR
jgi:hydrogenase expression/formation protein HypC